MVQPTARRGFSVNVYLPAGDPEGLKVVEKSNCSGRGLVIPKAIFGKGRSREQPARTGVYLLVSPSDKSALPTVYVGEEDPVRPGIEQHVKNQEFWTRAIVFISKATNVTKAHVQRLESRLVKLAVPAKRCVRNNGNSPALPTLSEADEAMAEGFLDDVLLCLAIIGCEMFEANAEAAARGTGPLFFLAVRGVAATGRAVPAEIGVLKNLTAVAGSRLPRSFLRVRDSRTTLCGYGMRSITFHGYKAYQASSSKVANRTLRRKCSYGLTKPFLFTYPQKDTWHCSRTINVVRAAFVKRGRSRCRSHNFRLRGACIYGMYKPAKHPEYNAHICFRRQSVGADSRKISSHKEYSLATNGPRHGRFGLGQDW
jgi:hypothetical protein